MSRARHIEPSDREWVFLRETEAFYRCLVEQSLVGVFIHQDERFVYVNPRFAEIFGYTTEEILDLSSALDVIAEPDRPIARENIRRRVAGETPSLVYAVRGLRKDGRVIDLEVYGARAPYRGRPAAIGTVLEVTERKRAEAALRESEALKGAIFETALDAIITMDDSGRILEFNPAAERIFGYRRDEVLGQAIVERIIPPSLRERHREGLSRYLAGSEGPYLGRRIETTAQRADGSEFPVELAITRIGNGSRPVFTGFVRDISDRVRSEQQLRESEARFRALTEASSVGIFIYQGERYRYVNRTVEEVTGYSREELLGMPLWEVAHPEFRDISRGRALARQLGEQVEPRYELKLLRKDGREVWVEVNASRFFFDGRPAVAGAAFDITERKRAEEALRASEERYRRIVDTANEGIWMLDGEGRIEFLNERLAEMFGYPREQMLSRPVSDFVESAMLEEAARRLECCHHGITQKFDFPFRRADGSRLWAFVSCTPIPTEDGKFERALSMLVDVTERKVAEDLLRQSGKQLRALVGRLEAVREEERTRIAREMHDELGQALTFMKIDLASLRQEVAARDEEAAPLVEKFDSLLDQVAATLRTVRRLSTELRPAILDYLGLKAALEWQCEEFQTRTGIPTRCDFPAEDLPLDAERSTAIFRIFQEVLTNIARHSEASRVRVAMKVEPEELRLVIEDNGLGIPAEKVSDSASLGLCGMRERAAPFGGNVAIGLPAGGGTSVEVRMPIASVRAASEGA